MSDDRDQASTPAEHSPPRSKRSHRDLIAAITSGFVGALALGSSLYNLYLQRQQVSAAVWPNLEWSITPKENGVAFVVANRGTGPALVKSFVVWVDDKKVHSWPEALNTLDPTGHADPDDMNDLVRTVSPGGEVTAVTVMDPVGKLNTLRERRRLAVELCYCSTLDECWRLHVVAAKVPSTTQVSSCPAEREPFEALNDRQIDSWLRFMSRDAGAPDK